MRELKENMGRFVFLIKKGEKITLNYRGKPFALVSCLQSLRPPLSKEEKFLAVLEQKGLITKGKKGPYRRIKPIKIGGKKMSDLVIESRE